MTQYYVETRNGPRGPYTDRRIIDGVNTGRIPGNAVIRDAVSNRTMRATDLISDTGAQDSDADQYVQPSRPQPQAPAPQQAYPQQPAYPQYPSYRQPNAYPSQPGYPQQYPYPQQGYPGNANQYQPYGTPASYPYPRQREYSGLAIASLVLSLATIVVGCVPLWIGGIICGVMAINECHPKGEKLGRGMALAGLWTGVIFGVLTVLGVIMLLSIGEF